MELRIERFLIQIGKQKHAPTVEGPALVVGHVRRRKTLVGVVVVVQGQPDALEILAARRHSIPLSMAVNHETVGEGQARRENDNTKTSTPGRRD
jgi:hypothetical protein